MTTTEQSNTDEWIDLKEPKQFCRLLYTNPVCFLSTIATTEQQRNVMVLSWLTATNNEGRFMFSLNRRRHTASHVRREEAVIDDDHYLILGEVTRAFVHCSCWDAAKNFFRPDDQSPPYLTFLGSQTFGYVVAS